MPDNKQHEWDPGLVDRGWAQLSHQLDEVMPTRQRRRRAIWWWLPLLLLLGSGTAWWIIGEEVAVEQTPPPTTTTVEEQAPIANTSVITADVASSHLDEEYGQATITTSLTESSGNGVKYVTSQGLTVPTNEEDALNRTSLSSSVSALGVRDQAITVATIDANDSNGKLVVPDVAFEEKAELSRIANSSLQLLPSKRLYPDLLPISPIEQEVSIAKKIRKTHIYAIAEGGQFFKNSWSFAAFGIGIDRAINKNWNWGASLHYRLAQANLFDDFSNRSRALSDLGIISEESNDIAVPVNNGANRNSYDLAAVYRNIRSEQMGIRLNIGRRLSHRWKLFAGLEAIYYLDAILSTQPITPNGELFDLNNDDGEFSVYDNRIRVDTAADNLLGSVTYPAVQSGASLSPQRWQLATQFGIDYRLSRGVSAQVSYRRQLTDWSALASNVEANSALQLGLKFWLR